MTRRTPGGRPSLAFGVLLAALFACGGEVAQADRDERTAKCATDPSFDRAASTDALGKLRAGACRSTLFGTKCEDWWDYVVTACVYEDTVANDGSKRIEVHSALVVETDTAREKRERMCDAVREKISMTDRATIQNGRGNTMTTCGKPRRKP